jgi:hypothetical protein
MAGYCFKAKYKNTRRSILLSLLLLSGTLFAEEISDNISVRVVSGNIIMHDPLTLQYDYIIFEKDSTVITNGHELIVVANIYMHLGENASIKSFIESTEKNQEIGQNNQIIPREKNGLNASAVSVKARYAKGLLRISNNGQNGLNGKVGSPGQDGQDGRQGKPAVSAFLGCKSGPGYGTDGENGGDGDDGEMGGDGGDGGQIVIKIEYPYEFRVITSSKPGSVGKGGDGGKGGKAGIGGLGGRGAAGCHGRESERKGRNGLPGKRGNDGQSGQEGKSGLTTIYPEFMLENPDESK